MGSSYGEDVFANGNLARVYGLVVAAVAQRLTRYPAVMVKFGGDEDAWAMKFIYRDPSEEPMESLEYDAGNARLNPDLIRLLQACETDKEFEHCIAGEVAHWLADLFDQTEFGRTRRVLEHDMEVDEGHRFVNAKSSSLWRLRECPDVRSNATEDLLWPVAGRHQHRIKWPTDQALADFREGRRIRRPKYPRKQVTAMLYDVLKAADGTVEANMLTRLFVACHPAIVEDFVAIMQVDIDLERMAATQDGNRSGTDHGDAYEDDELDYADAFGGEW
ncbi:hypothetical protein KIH79_00660 [Bifidobacterium sp. 82T10]|uniref:Uncharacterized protein n=1 Tax=Bifidobacterium miconis TaxID=2834435 RepID=A0ABS6WBQ7_9BIFI|nr:hypothetical protein [Bifidobacterium miconis]MBW3091484.1 hypothetical protein [Bifidobacterium miconis]